MFGEERVNNSVALLSNVLVAFSVGQILALVAAILQVYVHSQEKTLFTTASPAGGPDGTVMQRSGLLVLFIGRTVTHASLALFSAPTNTSSVLHALRGYVYHGSQGSWRSFFEFL